MGIVKVTETGNSVDSLLVPGFHEKATLTAGKLFSELKLVTDNLLSMQVFCCSQYVMVKYQFLLIYKVSKHGYVKLHIYTYCTSSFSEADHALKIL